MNLIYIHSIVRLGGKLAGIVGANKLICLSKEDEEIKTNKYYYIIFILHNIIIFDLYYIKMRFCRIKNEN